MVVHALKAPGAEKGLGGGSSPLRSSSTLQHVHSPTARRGTGRASHEEGSIAKKVLPSVRPPEPRACFSIGKVGKGERGMAGGGLGLGAAANANANAAFLQGPSKAASRPRGEPISPASSAQAAPDKFLASASSCPNAAKAVSRHTFRATAAAAAQLLRRRGKRRRALKGRGKTLWCPRKGREHEPTRRTLGLILLPGGASELLGPSD